MLRRAASLGSGGCVFGACTESLGSETGDLGGDAEIDQQLGQHAAAAADAPADGEDEGDEGEQSRAAAEKRPRLLPPPMPRAAEGATFMRAERRGGRLILTEVRVNVRRREVFRASRAGGRLRLQFAADDRDGASPRSPDDETSVVGGCCGNGAGEFCQVAAGVKIGAVMGT